MEELIGKHG